MLLNNEKIRILNFYYKFKALTSIKKFWTQIYYFMAVKIILTITHGHTNLISQSWF